MPSATETRRANALPAMSAQYFIVKEEALTSSSLNYFRTLIV
jgi:hypothetical protein